MGLIYSLGAVWLLSVRVVAITRVAGYPVSGPDLFSQFGTRLNGAIGRLGMDQDLAISIYTPHGQLR